MRFPRYRVAAWMRVNRDLIALFLLGLAARIVLIPLGHGQDFVVWDKASTATLHGVNVYAHHPDYPGGPYAYFPLFLYLELPMQWLAMHTGGGFLVLGKLPILAGDIATAALIVDAVIARGGRRRAAIIAATVFWLNPLVLYDSAYYGRFDSVGCALLLLALRYLRRRDGSAVTGSVWYAMAVAAKTFPAFVIAGVFRAVKDSRIRAVAAGSAAFALLLVPYLGSLRAVLHDVFTYDATKTPQGFAWQRVIPHLLDAQGARWFGYGMLAAFGVLAIWLSRTADLDRYVVLVLVLFLVLNKVVLEQYLIWPMPWLAIFAVTSGEQVRQRAAGALLAILTLIGTFSNETYHPLGRAPGVFTVLLVLSCLAYLVLERSRIGTIAYT